MVPPTLWRVTATSGMLFLITSVAIARELNVDIHRISDTGVGDKIGSVVMRESEGGLTLQVTVTGLPKGQRGFHLHEKGDCGPAAKDGKLTAGMAAGEHYDPENTKSHKGPDGTGHKGDLPALRADEKGNVKQTVAAPRLKLADTLGRTLVIHEGGDNYTDEPESGGGQGRIACGVVPQS
jgi:superoxide dismutase, Cu-Zn family